MATEYVVPFDPADDTPIDVRSLLVDELMKVNRKAMRCPRHWEGRLEAMHAVMDALVDQILELDRARLR